MLRAEQSRAEQSRAEQSRAELGRNLISSPGVMLCHFLRRREMMDNREEYAGILYIDSGFLDTRVHYDETPIYNANYPDAWATTYFPVQLNDVINCEELRVYNADGRIRFYQSNGAQTGYILAGVINISASLDYMCSRLMMLNAEAPIPNELTVTHPNGTIDTYKIIDRR